MEGHKSIETVAADWLARRDCGDWSDAEQARFELWLNESLVHRITFLRLEDVWERAQRLRALRTASTAGQVPPPGRWVFRPFFYEKPGARRSARLPGLSGVLETAARFRALAAIVLLAIVGVTLYLWPSGTYYRTHIGGIASVAMPDGSAVTLNTDSAIRLAVTQTERRIVLERGEAFFDVAKDRTRPFVVTAGEERIVAVGTRFSVRRDADEMQVVVTEGRVRIESTGSEQPVPAGSIARISDAGVLVQKRDLAATEELLSWRSGILVFSDMTLSRAAAEFNRYNIRKIIIADPSIRSLQIAGSFHATNVEAFVRLVERGYPVRVETREDGFVLGAR